MIFSFALFHKLDTLKMYNFDRCNEMHFRYVDIQSGNNRAVENRRNTLRYLWNDYICDPRYRTIAFALTRQFFYIVNYTEMLFGFAGQFWLNAEIPFLLISPVCQHSLFSQCMSFKLFINYRSLETAHFVNK